MPPEEFDTLLSFFKALADANRLRIVGLLAEEPRSVDELAALLGLKAPTVSHHLARLKKLGLVEMDVDGTTHIHRLVPERLESLSKELLGPEGLEQTTADIRPRDFRDKVLATFFDGDTLVSIPASRKKREVILDWLAQQFEPGRDYPEKEVNQVLLRHHWDSATLRRELVGGPWMTRDRGIYRRVGLDESAE